MQLANSSTVPRDSRHVDGVFEKFGLVHRAILHREQVWGYYKGQGIRVCPHALGWRGHEPYVLGLIVRDRREPIVDGLSWEWLMEWQWIRLDDLSIPFARKADWVTCPREHRPSTDHLTHIVIEAE